MKLSKNCATRLAAASALLLVGAGASTAALAGPYGHEGRHHAWRHAGYAAQYPHNEQVYFVRPAPRTIDDFPVAGN